VLIDWFTVGAQLFNFLILVWLLHRFLYGPVTRAMAARAEKISERMAEAERVKRESTELGERHRLALHAFEEERAGLREAAKADVAKWQDERLREARAEVEALEDTWRQSLEMERASFLSELRLRAAHEIFEVARKVLGELSSSELERQIVVRFIQELAALSPDEQRRFVDSAKEGAQEITVRSAFELAAAERTAVTRAVHDVLPNARLTFDTHPDLVAGVALRSGDYKLAWTIAEHLDVLEDRLRALVARDQTHATAPSATTSGAL
jgi:F-type H+-transporting ATPase subunit b